MNQKIHKNYKMRVIEKKEHKKIEKKSRDATKLGRNWSKRAKILKNSEKIVKTSKNCKKL